MRKSTVARLQLATSASTRALQQLDRATTRGVEVAAVRAEMHAGQRDFLEAGRRDALDLAQHRRRAARSAARLASSG